MVVVNGGVGLLIHNGSLVKSWGREKMEVSLSLLALDCSVELVASSPFSLDLGYDPSLAMPYKHEQHPKGC